MGRKRGDVQEELKSCPFCGGGARKNERWHGMERWKYVECEQCEATADSVTRWNARHESARTASVLDDDTLVSGMQQAWLNEIPDIANPVISHRAMQAVLAYLRPHLASSRTASVPDDVVERVAKAILASAEYAQSASWHDEEYKRHTPYWNDAAKAALSAIGYSGWRPIETAPRDGTTIMVYFRRHGWVTVSWDSQEDEGPRSEYAHWHVDDFKHGPYPVRGYRSGDDLAWMPLPPPPAA